MYMCPTKRALWRNIFSYQHSKWNPVLFQIHIRLLPSHSHTHTRTKTSPVHHVFTSHWLTYCLYFNAFLSKKIFVAALKFNGIWPFIAFCPSFIWPQQNLVTTLDDSSGNNNADDNDAMRCIALFSFDN